MEHYRSKFARLGKELVELTWSLSQDGCPDFSSSTITVEPQLAPDAANDIMTVDQGSNQAQAILLANDILTGVPSVTFEFTSEPTLGDVTDQGDGDVAVAQAVDVCVHDAPEPYHQKELPGRERVSAPQPWLFQPVLPEHEAG